MSSGSLTWTYTYDANGLRTKRTTGSSTYIYTYHGSQLTHMTYNGIGLHFYYDATGRPLSVIYGGDTYYYVTNLQGDVVAILDSTGAAVVEYTYDAWGRPLSKVDNTSFDLGDLNPLRYRGYVYDRETGLYYLQSRYYNPTWGRWINADSLPSQGSVLGNNMFAYCLNNPVNMTDNTGELPFFAVTAAIGAVVGAIIGGVAAAKSGGNVWAGIGIGAVAGGLVGAGLGAAAGVMLAGSATASTASVVMGAATLYNTVAIGGLGAGAAYIANNIMGNPIYTDPVLFSGGDVALQAAQNYAASGGGTIIGDTIIGQTANSLSSRFPLCADFIWKGASELFCQQSTGSAHAFIYNGTFEASTSVFWNYEMPVLIDKARGIVEIIIEFFWG